MALDRVRILDALYGDIALSAELSALARTVAVQRLRHIRLSNIDSFNLPGIANISRYEHVLGAAILAGESGIANRVSEVDRLTFQAAAMLHDAAIAPFGHLVEEALAYGDTVEFNHETKWLSLLGESQPSYQLGGSEIPLFIGRQSGLRGWARSVFGPRDAESRIKLIFETVSGQGPWGAAIAGTLDIDNLDNLSRLALHLGFDADRHLPRRLARAMVGVSSESLPIMRGDVDHDVRAWSELRYRVYDRLMPSRDDMAAKIMILFVVAEALATDSGDLAPNNSIWTLTDQLFVDRLHASINPAIRGTIEAWMVGDLWTLSEVLWFRGACPKLGDLSLFNALLSAELKRQCFSYRIKDKRHRRIELQLENGPRIAFGQDVDTWLLAVGSPLAKPFTASETRQIVNLAIKEFDTESLASPTVVESNAASLFDNELS